MAYEVDDQPSAHGLVSAFPVDDYLLSMADQLFQTRTTGDDWHAVHNAMEDYLWEEHHVVLDDYIDWKQYGEWYEAHH